MQAAACRDRADQGLQLRRQDAFDQTVHQRRSVMQGPARRARPGSPGASTAAGRRVRTPPLSAVGPWNRRLGDGWRMGEPGGPAEAERAVNQDLVTADGDVRADLEVGPAQLVLPPGPTPVS